MLLPFIQTQTLVEIWIFCLTFYQAIFIFKFSKAATLLNKLHKLKINKHSDSYRINVIGDKSINFSICLTIVIAVVTIIK
jgi:hypothetical protein